MQLSIGSEPMRVAVVGSRKFQLLGMVDEVVEALGNVCIVSGGAKGVDKRAEEVARRLGHHEPVIFKPKWRYSSGKVNMNAGKERNTKIVDFCQCLVAFWDGKSRGTLDSLTKARARGKPLALFTHTPDGVEVTTERWPLAEGELHDIADRFGGL